MRTPAGHGPGSGVLHDRLPGPAVPWMVIGQLMRCARERSGVSRAQAAMAIRLPDGIIAELEAGQVRLPVQDLIALCRVYGIYDYAERTTLLGLATQSAPVGWWSPYRDVIPAWLDSYLALEQAAGVIRVYESSYVPGLLRTPGYVRAVARLGLDGGCGTDIARRVELHVRRQDILYRPDPPKLWTVLDEAALFRPVGGVATMAAQLEHLIEMCGLPHVTVQILRLNAADRLVPGGPITMLRLPEDGLGDIVYLEHLTSATFITGGPDGDAYRHSLNLLAVHAAPAADSPEILRQFLTMIRTRS